jgi:hypothetical protein
VLAQSLPHALRFGQEHIARPHLLRALLDVRDGAAARTLVELGVDLDALAARADDLVLSGDSRAGSGPSTEVRAASLPQPGRRPRRFDDRSELGSDDDTAAAELANMVGRRDALANAIRRYGRHDPDCDQARACMCGLQDVLDELDPPAAAGMSDTER